jgi:hypothetical protein
MRLTPWLPWLLVTSSACRKIEPVPEELDALVHYLWAEMASGEDEQILAAVDNLATAVDADTLDEAILEGEVSDLTADEIAFIDRSDADPADATGLLLADRVACSQRGFERIIAHPDQDELYVGVYDSYERYEMTSKKDFLDGTTQEMTWKLRYSSSVIGAAYTVNSSTLVRRIDEVVLVRAHMLEPATFDNEDSNNFLTQDYHLEIYWPGEGDLNHVYGLWKDTKMLGLEDEDESVQRITLDKMLQWDEGTGELCAEGLP